VEDARHAIADQDLPFAREEKKRGRRRERLRERGEVVDRVLVERRFIGLEAAIAERAVKDEFSLFF
jgi:hypothetical protein